MQIGGFIKESFIDWKGKTSAVIFTKGCNFRCGYCHNPSLVLPQLIKESATYNSKDILEYLASRVGWLDGVVISGGEPTLQKHLVQFIKQVKYLGYKIKLDTNGSNPIIIKKLLETNLLDFIALDIKNKFVEKEYNAIVNYTESTIVDKVQKTLEYIIKYNVDFELRTTILNEYHTPNSIKELKSQFKNFNYVLQDFKLGDIVANYV